ncbi:unnamed protein product [Didymodactylos carnosus]|uniref:Uncharacterized protein n=1 Tax=Didymodactylos carnosus TaxID=1234261 RepID=A0A816AX04_9BILA|nr:unnamed protein product [Didymodactylos carnosus]CAF1600311.1 unnamed protein product [Didymodactylos carnosus]CAF3774215.1 unnamed protein product [Didymodactylos carnosus]CAF4477190.1 unnamed protein product [Didymodactylos carnosus]
MDSLRAGIAKVQEISDKNKVDANEKKANNPNLPQDVRTEAALDAEKYKIHEERHAKKADYYEAKGKQEHTTDRV